LTGRTALLTHPKYRAPCRDHHLLHRSNDYNPKNQPALVYNTVAAMAAAGAAPPCVKETAAGAAAAAAAGAAAGIDDPQEAAAAWMQGATRLSQFEGLRGDVLQWRSSRAASSVGDGMQQADEQQEQEELTCRVSQVEGNRCVFVRHRFQQHALPCPEALPASHTTNPPTPRRTTATAPAPQQSNNQTTSLLASRYLAEDFYDLVDVDSFGSETLHLPAAIDAVRFGGMLFLTSTDGMSSAGACVGF